MTQDDTKWLAGGMIVFVLVVFGVLYFIGGEPTVDEGGRMIIATPAPVPTYSFPPEPPCPHCKG